MKIIAGINAAGYSAQLMQAAKILRMGGRGLAVFLHNTAGINPCLRFIAPPEMLSLDEADDLRAVLHVRVAEAPVTPALMPLLALLIEQLNDDGLLDWNDEVAAILTAEYGAAALAHAVAALQALGPAGIGGRDLSECLSLQLAALPDSAAKTAAMTIVNTRLHWFLRRRFDKLPRRHLAAATDILESLSFRPGAALNRRSEVPVPADVEIVRINGLWKARPGAADYSPSARRGGERGDWGRARQVVTAVAARRRQLLKLTQFAADRQSRFLAEGMAELRPLPMREAAAQLGVTPAMVSHIVADKYFLTGDGVYALKLLFARTAPGGGSALAVREQLQSIIASEDPARPYSDRRLQQELRRRNAPLARRTVGKYRAAAGILCASMRKRPPR